MLAAGESQEDDLYADVGEDTRTGLDLVEYRYDVPFKFTGKIDKITLKIDRPQLSPEDIKKLEEARRNNKASE